MNRLEAVQYLIDNANPEFMSQELALLDAIMDVMYASEGAFDMTQAEVESWLNDSLKLVKRGRLIS